MTDMTIDGFDNREFSVEELTESINIVPNRYGLVTQMGVFGDPIPLSTTYVRLERNNWSLNLLPATERGAPGTKGSVGKRDAKLFEIPQITHEDAVQVAELQNLRAFGSNAPRMLEDKVNEKLVTMAQKHFITHEWYRVNALQGIIRDADNGVMLNLYTEFGITPPVVAFGLAGKSIMQRIRDLKRYTEENLKGETMSGIVGLASAEIMEMLFADSDIKDIYKAALGAHQMFLAMNPTVADRRFQFTVADNVTFIEYNGTASSANADGTYTARKFIPAGDVRFFPIGTTQTARQYVAPGDFAEALNSPGQILYAKEENGRFGRSRDLLTQSNILPLWNRPELLVRGTTSNTGGTIT